MTNVSEALVRKKLQEMLTACEQEKRRPSVLGLARAVGMSNTTFRRNYPDVADEIGRRRSEPATPPPGSRNEVDRLAARNAKIRRRNRELQDQLKLATAQIQFLALRAARLEEALEDQTKVTRIAERRPRG